MSYFSFPKTTSQFLEDIEKVIFIKIHLLLEFLQIKSSFKFDLIFSTIFFFYFNVKMQFAQSCNILNWTRMIYYWLYFNVDALSFHSEIFATVDWQCLEKYLFKRILPFSSFLRVNCSANFYRISFLQFLTYAKMQTSGPFKFKNFFLQRIMSISQCLIAPFVKQE